MKFNCGPTWKERHFAKVVAKRKRLHKWHKKFLWLPHRFPNNDCRWLEFCEYREIRLHFWTDRDLDSAYHDEIWYDSQSYREEYRAL